MTDLKIDAAGLSELGDQLSAIAKEFSGANAHSDRVADAVGHDRLHSAVRDFAHKWDDTRGKMTNDISTLGQMATAVGDNFQKTDATLKQSLDEPAPSPSPSPAPHPGAQ